jgi:hypothetical protein
MRMSAGVPLTRLYFFSACCGLFALVYGFLGAEPTPVMQMLLGLGPAVAVAAWLAADAKQTRTVLAHDAGFFFYVTWPLSIPWYAVRTRGRRGWRLAAQLYVIALAGWLGFIVGAVIAGLGSVAA